MGAYRSKCYVGGATFDFGAEAPGRGDEAQDNRARLARRRLRGEATSTKTPDHGATFDICRARWRRVDSEGPGTKGVRAREEWRTHPASARPEVPVEDTQRRRGTERD